MSQRNTIFPGSRSRYPVSPMVTETASDLVPIYSGHPWKAFTKHWAVGIKKNVTVVSEGSQPDCLFTIRKRKPDDQLLIAARQVKGDRLLPIRELFTSEEGIFFISPYCEISLESINSCRRYPSSKQLALLARQVRSQTHSVKRLNRKRFSMGYNS